MQVKITNFQNTTLVHNDDDYSTPVSFVFANDATQATRDKAQEIADQLQSLQDSYNQAVIEGKALKEAGDREGVGRTMQSLHQIQNQMNNIFHAITIAR